MQSGLPLQASRERSDSSPMAFSTSAGPRTLVPGSRAAASTMSWVSLAEMPDRFGGLHSSTTANRVCAEAAWLARITPSANRLAATRFMKRLLGAEGGNPIRPYALRLPPEDLP